MIGIRLGAKKTARLKEIRSLQSDLQMFSEHIALCSEPLTEVADELQGPLCGILHTYFSMRNENFAEAESADRAIEVLCGDDSVKDGVRMFLTGLSTAARNDLVNRAKTLTMMLGRVEKEAESEAKQARVIRIAGVLTGAGLAILLL